MTIDFRVAIDWQDNGHINWLQTATDERQLDYPNLITGGQIQGYTVTGGTINAASGATNKSYGGDYVDATNFASAGYVDIGKQSASVIGEITVDFLVTYTACLWVKKTSTSDDGKDVYVRIYETESVTPGAHKISSGPTKINTVAQQWVQHTVTFTTAANTEKIFFRVDSTDGAWTGTAMISGFMLVEGSIAPSVYNNGLRLLNELTTAQCGAYTVLGGTVNTATLASYKNYGIDYVQLTALPATCTIAKVSVSGARGEIPVSANTTYTMVLFLKKQSTLDNANDLYIGAIETLAATFGVLQATYSNALTSTFAEGWVKHTVTFKTTATTERVYCVIEGSGTFAFTVDASGFMLIEGNEIPATFNDGAIKPVTHRVVEARWNVGFKTSVVNGSVANENRLECSLYNLDDYITDTKYSDVHRIYIEGSHDNGATYTRLYTGWTQRWQPIFNILGYQVKPQKHLKMTAVSSRFYMDGVKARLPMQEGVPSHTIMIALANAVDLPNGTTIPTGTPRAGDTSYNFSYAGMNWDEGVDLLRALADTAWGDGRIVYFDRSDELHGFPLSNLSDTSLIRDVKIATYVSGEMDYRYSDPWYNRVEMNVSPRVLSSTSDKRLWRLPESISIAVGETETILARYNDEDKPYQIGARNVSYDNLVVSGGTVTVTLTPKSTSCYIEIENTGGTVVTVTDLRIIGQKVKTWDSYFEQREFSTEITSNGNNTLTINSGLPDDRDRAVTHMNSWLATFGEKHYRLWSMVTPGNRDVDDDMINYSIANIIHVPYPVHGGGTTQVNHVVIGEEWIWRKGQYEKKWYLERIYDSSNSPVRPSP